MCWFLFQVTMFTPLTLRQSSVLGSAVTSSSSCMRGPVTFSPFTHLFLGTRHVLRLRPPWPARLATASAAASATSSATSTASCTTSPDAAAASSSVTVLGADGVAHWQSVSTCGRARVAGR